jgi:amidase
MTPLASGTDLGGSLRQPAQACGVASIRPGRGRVPDFNPSDPPEPGIGFQLMNVNGPMGRRVEDLRLGLTAMAGGDWRDPWWAPVPLDALASTPRKVALVLDPAGGGISSQVRSGVEGAGRVLAEAGYEVVEAEPPRINDAVAVWKAVCFNELLNQLEPVVRDFCGAGMTRTFARYRAVEPEASPARAYAALAQRCAVLRDWLGFFEDYPLIVAPVGTEPPLGRDEDIASPEQTREVVHAFRMVVAVNALGLPAATVPVGVEDALPQVVQIIGPPFGELRCLAAAEAIEREIGPLTPIDPR